MAPAKDDDTGEILPSSRLPPISPRGSSLANPTGDLSTSQPARDRDMDDGGDDCVSSSSSPPTHPAFFSTPSFQPKENPCSTALTGLNPTAASFSPLGSPLAVLIAKRPSPPNTGGVRQEDLARGVLNDVDTNIVAALSSDKANSVLVPDTDATPSPRESSNKKSKRKNKSKNDSDDVTGDDKGKTPEPTPHADAAKQDPADVDKKEAPPRAEKESSDVSGKDGEKKMPTPAGPKSFAEALKSPVERGAKRFEKRDSLASTAVDFGYPDLHSDPGDDEDDREQRQQDQQNAPQALSIRWAPLYVPFARRLQMVAVLAHCSCIGVSLSVFFFSCGNFFWWPGIIAYLLYVLRATTSFDGELRSRREWARRLRIWTYFAEYFPVKLHKTHPLRPTRKYILGYHPHGIISHGAWAAFATEALGFSEKFPGITNSLLTLDFNFRLPLYREYLLFMGVQSVSKESMTNLLTRGGSDNEGMGRAVTVVVGGAREALEARPKKMNLIIKKRKGFVKVALKTGADLVPVLAFGENDLYDQIDPQDHPWIRRVQGLMLNVWKFTLPVIYGRGIFNYDVGWMPHRRPMNIVVGKPIPVVQASEPDNAEVDRLHDLYTEELQKIWDRYKADFAPDRKEEMQFMS